VRIVALLVALTMLGLCAVAGAEPVELGPLHLRDAELVVVDAHGTRRTPIHLAPAPGCPDAQRCYTGIAEDRLVSLVVQLGPGTRALPVSIEARAHDAGSVREVSVHLAFVARGFDIVGRDFRSSRPQRAILDRLDPRWIGIDDAALLVDADADGVRVARNGKIVDIDLELLAEAARPFGHLPRCGHRWRDVHGRVAVLDRYLQAGDVLAAHGELLLARATPVVVSPWPDGRLASFVITDHADQTSAPTLHALLGGTSDADLDHASGGLLGHHLLITKSLFMRGVLPRDGARPQLEDHEVVALAEHARAAGIELAPHSATPVTDSRRTTDEALSWFADHGSHVWIDHQPQTNCEGFGQAGWHAGTGIADLLSEHHFQDLWDTKEWSGSALDERDAAHPAARAPVLWPLGRLEPDGPDGLWLFRSTWAFVPTSHFFARYSARGLDQLEAARGIHIAHTYLETLHPRGTFFGRRNVMLRDATGRVRLDPRLEAFFDMLHVRDERGTLWIAPIGVVGDRVRALREVRVRVTEAGTLAITQPTELDGLTLEIETAVGVATNEAVRGQRKQATYTRLWLSRCAPDEVRSAVATCTIELALENASLWLRP
jgi:hypothetical protein